MGDLISRQAAIDLVRDVCNAVMSGCNSHYDSEVGDEVYDDILEVNAILTCNKEVRKALKGMPSAQQDCTECEEYDHERHYCPKFCDVIRKTADELQVEASCKLPERKTGHWIPCSERLPVKDGDYIVTYEKGYASDYGLDPIGIAPFEVDCEGFGFWQEDFDMHTLGSLGTDWVDINVIAWMEKPEPYKEGGVV